MFFKKEIEYLQDTTILRCYLALKKFDIDYEFINNERILMLESTQLEYLNKENLVSFFVIVVNDNPHVFDEYFFETINRKSQKSKMDIKDFNADYNDEEINYNYNGKVLMTNIKDRFQKSPFDTTNFEENNIYQRNGNELKDCGRKENQSTDVDDFYDIDIKSSFIFIKINKRWKFISL